MKVKIRDGTVLKVSELISELQERLEMYGDIPVFAHYESDFNPIAVIDVFADFDDDFGTQYIEIILED